MKKLSRENEELKSVVKEMTQDRKNRIGSGNIPKRKEEK